MVCSVLLVFGAATRLAALACAITMFTAFFHAHGARLTGPGNGELPFMYGAFIVLLLATALGVSAGLRSMMPLAIVACVAHSWPALSSSPLSFLASPIATYVLVAFAIGELIADKLPFTPSRLAAGPLIFRIISGATCGAAVSLVGGGSTVIGGIVGGMAGVAGAFGGYHVRRALTVSRGLPDLLVAVIEDAIAIGLALGAVFRV